MIATFRRVGRGGRGATRGGASGGRRGGMEVVVVQMLLHPLCGSRIILCISDVVIVVIKLHFS